MPFIAESSHWNAFYGSGQARAYLRISPGLSCQMETKGGLSPVRGGTSDPHIRSAGGASPEGCDPQINCAGRLAAHAEKQVQ